MAEGPPSTTWGGSRLRGHPSTLIRASLLQRANSYGRDCRFWLSFKYSSSKFSSVPVASNKHRLPNRVYQASWILTWRRLVSPVYMQPLATYSSHYIKAQERREPPPLSRSQEESPLHTCWLDSSPISAGISSKLFSPALKC